jgi:UDP-N-acetylmuramate dehydrogenase
MPSKPATCRPAEPLRLDHAACRFAYRDSVFKQEGWHLDGQRVITRVTFRLPKAWQPLLGYAISPPNSTSDGSSAGRPNAGSGGRSPIAEAVIRVRSRKLPDPATLPNAGSFFHNPLVSASLAERLAIGASGSAALSAARWPRQARRRLVDRTQRLERPDLGRVGMYEKQALVLVNRGGARRRGTCAGASCAGGRARTFRRRALARAGFL